MKVVGLFFPLPCQHQHYQHYSVFYHSRLQLLAAKCSTQLLWLARPSSVLVEDTCKTTGLYIFYYYFFCKTEASREGLCHWSQGLCTARFLKGTQQGWVLGAVGSWKCVDFLLSLSILWIHWKCCITKGWDAPGKVISRTFQNWVVAFLTTCWGFTSVSHLKSLAHHPCRFLVQIIESCIVSTAFRETMVLFQSAGGKVFSIVVAGFNDISVYNKQPLCVCICVWILLGFLPIFLYISFLNVIFYYLLWKELCSILSAFCFILSLPCPERMNIILCVTFSLVHYHAPL